MAAANRSEEAESCKYKMRLVFSWGICFFWNFMIMNNISERLNDPKLRLLLACLIIWGFFN